MAKTSDRSGGAKRSQAAGRYVLVGPSTRKAAGNFIVCKSAQIGALVLDASPKQVIVSTRRSATEELLRAGLKRRHRGRMGELLSLEPPRPESVPSLLGLFGRVLGGSGYSWLPVDELTTVLSGKDAADRIIGGAADPEGESLALVRGDLSTITVPFSFFTPSGDGTRPDFRRLSFTDFGATVGLGDYEASADGILYEFDPAYRKRLHKERRASEKSFGASLRRLRLQRRLKRTDFPGVNAKTIARIERNEVEKLHGKTLQILAQRLGVAADEIESY